MKGLTCEISLNNVEHNLNLVKKLIDRKKVIGVIKANAYGLGIEGISDFLKDKVDYLAVAEIDEAKRISQDVDVLILSPLIKEEDFLIDQGNIIFTIDNEEIINKIPKDKDIKIHIYVDTGMNRMGIKPENLDKVIDKLNVNRPQVSIHGIYTHLHNTKNVKYTLNQISTFKKACEKYIGKVPMIHVLNSSGTINDEIRTACDFTNAVRAGNILYGYEGLDKGFKKTYNYYADIINVCEVKAGEHIGYGCTYKAKRDMKIGVLGIGNIEHIGFSRDVKHNIFYDLLKVIYNHLKYRPIIFSKNGGIRIVSKPNMNITLVDATNLDINEKLRIEISPILAESSIPKIYEYEL